VATNRAGCGFTRHPGCSITQSRAHRSPSLAVSRRLAARRDNRPNGDQGLLLAGAQDTGLRMAAMSTSRDAAPGAPSLAPRGR